MYGGARMTIDDIKVEDRCSRFAFEADAALLEYDKLLKDIGVIYVTPLLKKLKKAKTRKVFNEITYKLKKLSRLIPKSLANHIAKEGYSTNANSIYENAIIAKNYGSLTNSISN